MKTSELKIKNALNFGRFSLELEEKREQSIITQSSHMLTAFSLFSAAMLMAIPIVIEQTIVPKEQVLSLAGLLFIPLVASLVLTIIAQWRYKYQTMITAEEFRDKFLHNEDEYQCQSQFDSQWIDQIAQVQQSKIGTNNRRARLIKASMICFLVSIGILIFANALFIILYA